VAKVAGFSLHVGGICAAHQRDKREQLCRVSTGPPGCVQRLSLNTHGKIVYTRKTACRDGITPRVVYPHRAKLGQRLVSCPIRVHGGRFVWEDGTDRRRN